MGSKDVSQIYDAVIVGGGPAGLTAALYLARARYRVVVVEKEKFGGQITITEEIVNYPGVAKTSGTELTETMRQQAESFGAEFMMAEVTNISESEEHSGLKVIQTSSGSLECLSVLLAVGSSPRRIGFKGEEEFKGRGVAYCATCDGEFFTGKDVFVIGGGFAAAEEGVFLTKYAKQVHIMFRKADFSCASATAEEAYANDKITIHPFTVIEEVQGDTFPQVLRYKNVQTGEVGEYRAPEGDTFGIFVLAGYTPATEWLKAIVDLTTEGNIITDANQKTSVEGIFAAGDVCVKDLRQVVTATGEAASAATQMERYIAAMQKETGIVPVQPAKRIQKPADSCADTAATSGTELSGGVAAELSHDGLLSPDMIAQLNAVFERMSQPVILKLFLDDQAVSSELLVYAEALAELTDKVNVEIASEVPDEVEVPYVRVYLGDGMYTGLAFHGVPGGHEFTSFVLGLYNASGPGQPLEEESRKAIEGIAEPHKIQILVSLSCTMCPDTVVAAQRIASLNSGITAEAYDINHFPGLKDAYRVMSVPCVVVDDGKVVSFGKKNVQQMLELITPEA